MTLQRADAPAAPLERLARASVLLDGRRDACAALRSALKPLAESDLVAVVGEQELLEWLEQAVEEARDELAALVDASGDTAEQRLENLERILDLPEWDVAAEVVRDLETRREAQEGLLKDYENRSRDWRDRIERLNRALDSAVKNGALVREQKTTVHRLGDLVKQTERALLEHRYGAADETLARLDREARSESFTRITSDLEKAEEYARQVRTQTGLLLIRAPLDAARHYEYTVLLRTPTMEGANGINIQASSTLVEQDRRALKDIIDEVTSAVDDGLTRRFQVAAEKGPATRHVGTGGDEPAGTSTDPLDERVTRVGALMYRLVMPEQMLPFVRETDSALSITTNDLELPWELMHDDGFLCLKRPVARMPMGQASPRRQRRASESGNLRFLLIYSDPCGNLQRAEREVRVIEKALKDEWESQIDVEVRRREEVSGSALNRLLAFEAFDVIHYAGHASFNREDPDLSGLLLHDQEVFFAQKIRRLLEGRPLVFINACESGRTANEDEPQCVGQYLGKPAEGLASAFLYGGALACIGSLWPIFDKSAEQFAVRFYNHILEGHVVGEAMRLARIATKEKFPNDITWASFVLYGDPTFRLARTID